MLEEAFGQYHDGMVMYAFQYMGNEKDAEDAVQELYLKFGAAGPLVFDDRKALKTYLYKSVRNTCLKKLDKKDALRYTIDIINQDIIEDVYSLYDEGLMAEIAAEIGKLSARTRRIFEEIFFEGKKYQQVADDMDISINTVKTLLKKGIKRLREHFKGRDNIFLLHLIL